MSVIYGIIALVWGGYVAQPEWFDDGPYELEQVYESLNECQIAKGGKNGVCVGESPSKLYLVTGKEVGVPVGKLEFVQCDHWAGCYMGSK
jgi:hypothetical protein